MTAAPMPIKTPQGLENHMSGKSLSRRSDSALLAVNSWMAHPFRSCHKARFWGLPPEESFGRAAVSTENGVAAPNRLATLLLITDFINSKLRG